jgi:hypothetical protein
MKRSVFTAAILIIPMLASVLLVLPGCVMGHDDDHSGMYQHDDRHDDHDSDHHDEHEDSDHH